MNQFKYIEGELWLDVKRPFAANYDNGEEFDKCLKAWQNRLHYPCSKELKAILKEGQVLRGDEFKLIRGKQILFTDQQQWQEMSITEKNEYFEMVAIPLPEQPPTVKEEWVETIEVAIIRNIEQGMANLPLNDHTSRMACLRAIEQVKMLAGAKWNQGKEAGETVKGDGWIDVKDELPKLNIEYNVAWDMGDGDPELVTTTMEFRVNDKRWIDTRNDDINVTEDVRFWRKLPKPPIQNK